MQGPSDHLAWAKHPASPTAALAVHELAQKDRRFRAIWQVLLAEGIVDKNGRLLIPRRQS